MKKIYKNFQSCGMTIKRDEQGGGTNIPGSARRKGIKTSLIVVLISISFMGSAQFYPQDSILFEINTVPVTIWDSPTNIWQIGTPHKTYLNAAWSAPKGIITDTIIPYPINTYSTFSFVINSKSLKQNFATYISFMQKFDTDTLLDRGVIEASYDGGGVWCELGNTGWICPNGPALITWDQDSSVSSHQKYNHLAVTSGRSDGWLFSRCILNWIIILNASDGIVPDSVMVRFIFTSDGSANGREGWLIDNIVFGYMDYLTGIPETPGNQSDLIIFPNPITGQSAIRNKQFAGPVTLRIFDRTGRLIRQESEVKTDHLILDRKDFLPGIYLMKLDKKQGNSQTARFIVQ